MVTYLPKMASASRLGSRVWLASRGTFVIEDFCLCTQGLFSLSVRYILIEAIYEFK